MSSFLLAKAIRTRSTTGNTRLLLLILADAASDNGLVGHMTIEDMAARCNAHRRTISRAMDDLRDAGLIAEEIDGLLVRIDEPLFEVDGVTFAEPDEDGAASPVRWVTADGKHLTMADMQPSIEDLVGPEHAAQARANWDTAVAGISAAPPPFPWKQEGFSIHVLPENEAEAQMLVAIEAAKAAEHAAGVRSAVQMAAALGMMGAEADAGPGVQIAPDRPITWGTGPDVPGFPAANTLIGALLRAAGVEPDPLVPLYWMRPGHQDDVRQLEADTGLSAAQIIETCRDMHLKAGPIRRLTALAPMIAREKRRPR